MLDLFFGISAGQTWQPGSSLTMADRGMRTQIISLKAEWIRYMGRMSEWLGTRVMTGEFWQPNSMQKKGCVFRICWTIRAEKFVMTGIAGWELPASFHLWKLWFSFPFPAGKHTSVEKTVPHIAVKVCSYCQQQLDVEILTLDSYLT